MMMISLEFTQSNKQCLPLDNLKVTLKDPNAVFASWFFIPLTVQQHTLYLKPNLNHKMTLWN